jgi:hypothetical protein
MGSNLKEFQSPSKIPFRASVLNPLLPGSAWTGSCFLLLGATSSAERWVGEMAAGGLMVAEILKG